MDEEGAEEGAGVGEEAAVFAALVPRRWIQNSVAEKTFIRLGAVGKLEPPRWLGRGAEGAEAEGEGREVAAAGEEE